MTDPMESFDEKRAVELLLEILKVEGPSGKEGAVAGRVSEMLLAAGIPSECLQFDDANTRIPDPTETGNLIVRLPGKGRPRLLAAHLDTVPLAVGVKPRVYGLWVSSDGRTALGADDRAGVAVLVAAAEALARSEAPHPPVTLLFTVREEGGIWGARCVDKGLLGDPEMGFSFDGGDPSQVVVAAPNSDKFTIHVRGRESHAGTAPEKGVSAVEIASLAVVALRKAGWLGKIKSGKDEGTSNVGVIRGGSGRNVVMGDLTIEAEARSHDPEFLDKIVKSFKTAFRRAAKAVKSSDGKSGAVRFDVNRAYHAFSLSPKNVAVAAAVEALEAAGLTPALKTQNGGLDACWLNEHGIPTVTFGTGVRDNHTKGERLNIPDYLKACRAAVLLATLPFELDSI